MKYNLTSSNLYYYVITNVRTLITTYIKVPHCFVSSFILLEKVLKVHMYLLKLHIYNVFYKSIKTLKSNYRQIFKIRNIYIGFN